MNTLMRSRAVFAFVLLMALASCSTMQSHNNLANQMQVAQQTGGIPGALKALESSATTDKQRAELLFNLERGELLRLNKQYSESTQAFLLADKKVNEWEEAAKTNPERLLATLGAATISERIKIYEGQDYEKVWLTTRLALNRVAANDLENARVDIKRTHEREAVIAEFRSKDTAKAEEEAKKKGAQNTGKEIGGYPVETLNDPEVLALKNGYQNALSHYLAGFLYEILNESGLAAPGYRKAIELKPNTAVLENGLRGLDDRTSFTHKRRQRMTDVLFVVEAGDAPARNSQAFTVPIPTKDGIRTVSISYPVVRPSTDQPLAKLTAGDKEFKLEKVVDVNVMARRALKDEMPALVLRNLTRAIVKWQLQKQLEKSAGVWGSVIGSVASIITEQADDRIWRRLPGRVYLARGYLPEGEHIIDIDGKNLRVNVKFGGQYSLVPLRLNGSEIIVGDIGSFGDLNVSPTKEPEPVPVPVKPKKPPVKSTPNVPAAPAK